MLTLHAKALILSLKWNQVFTYKFLEMLSHLYSDNVRLNLISELDTASAVFFFHWIGFGVLGYGMQH